MQIKKTNGKIFGAEFSAAEKKAMNMEIQRQLAEYDRKNANEIAAMVLWYLHIQCDFGHKRLEETYMSFIPGIRALCDRYEMTDNGDDIWLCTKMLKDYGVDIEEWLKQVKD